MDRSLIIEKEVIFNTNKNQVWDLLTNPNMTKQYMFGCSVVSNWEIGSPILWIGKTEENEDITYVKGIVSEFIKEEKVSFSMLDPNLGIKDIPKNYAQMTYKLTEINDSTRLILSQDFRGTDHAEKRYKESSEGWDIVIKAMKKILV